MKTLTIEWQRLLDEQQETCPRCGSTEQEVEKAVNSLKKELAPYEINVTLRKTAIDQESFKQDTQQSNKIMIAGKMLEEWLGAQTGQSKCCDACDDADCRTVEYAGQTHEAVPEDLIFKAGLIAASKMFGVQLLGADKKKSAVKFISKGCC